MEATEVLLLGTFHMANPGADMANVEADDVLAAQRQIEIKAVVESLLTFQPTKVLVEHPHNDRAIDDRYRSFCAGTKALSRSEVEQLGFRTAFAAGHPSIHPIDVMDKFYEEGVEKLLQQPVHAARWQTMRDKAEASACRVAEILRVGTIADALRVSNGPEERTQALGIYLNWLLPIADEGNSAGPVMVANWYRRNFMIAANIHVIAEPGDRLLVIYGVGHIPVLEHALGVSGRFRLHDALAYLPSA